VTWDVLREPEATAGALRRDRARLAAPALTRSPPPAAKVWFFNAWTARVNELPDVRAYPNAYWVWAASEAPSTWLHGAATSPGILPVRRTSRACAPLRAADRHDRAAAGACKS
jgi:hypothetical protein